MIVNVAEIKKNISNMTEEEITFLALSLDGDFSFFINSTILPALKNKENIDKVEFHSNRLYHRYGDCR